MISGVELAPASAGLAALMLSAGSGVISESMGSAMHGFFVSFPLAYPKLRGAASGRQFWGHQWPQWAESGGSALPDTARSPLSTVSSRHAPAAEGRWHRSESGFCRVYGLTAASANSEASPLTPTQLFPACVSI